MTEHHSYRPVRRLGQNFLRDRRVAAKLVEKGDLSRADIVLEPGSGYGTVTELILDTDVSKVLAVEKDRRLAEALRRKFEGDSRVVVLEGDVLRIDIPEFSKIIGTPAYNISSRLILLMLKWQFDSASIIFQAEFGDRLLAKPGSKNYGRLSVMASTGLQVEKVAKVSRTSFDPKPRVDSVLLKIKKSPDLTTVDYTLFEWLVRESFSQRRRLVSGAIRHALETRIGKQTGVKIMSAMSIPVLRVDQVGREEYENLTQQLETAIKEENIDKTRILQPATSKNRIAPPPKC